MKRTAEGTQLTDIVLEIFKLGGLLIAEGDELTREFGLNSARWKVLGALSNAAHPITVSSVARNMGLTRQAVQRIANEMVEDGLLYYQPNPEHKRAKLLALTQPGEQIIESLEQKQIRWVNSFAEKIEIKNLKLTSKVLQELTNRLTCEPLDKTR